MVEFFPGLCLFSKEGICICAKVMSFLQGGFSFFAGRPLLSPDSCHFLVSLIFMEVLLFSLWISCSHVMFYKEWTGLVVWATVAARDECSDESGFTRKLLDVHCNILEWLVTHVVSKQQVWMINQGVHIYWVQNFTHKTHDQCSCAKVLIRESYVSLGDICIKYLRNKVYNRC